MHIEELRDFCLQLPAATEGMPFGPTTLVFKVANKVFLLVGLDQDDDLCFNVKCDPEYAIALREQYEHTVLPGYHMNKKHWNTVYANRQIADETLQQFIVDSYNLVFHALPKLSREAIQNQ